jgi:hypothetical protein
MFRISLDYSEFFWKGMNPVDYKLQYGTKVRESTSPVCAPSRDRICSPFSVFTNRTEPSLSP